MSPASTESGRRLANRLAPALALSIGVLFLLPGIFVLFRTARLGGNLSTTLPEIWEPLLRTILLASAVAGVAAVLGTVLAWLVVRTNLPGRGLWRILLVLPLVLPSFVGAAAFLAALAPGGLLAEIFNIFSLEPPSFRGFVPAWFTLTIFTYPYVLLPVAARLLALRPSLEESARLLGRSALATFWQVTLPQIRSTVLTGTLLVFLYTLSDFGAVQLLGYDTLTRVIYATRLSSRGTSFTAATVLLLLAVIVVSAERTIRAKDQTDLRTRARPNAPNDLGKWKTPALALAALVSGLGLFVPIASLSTWSYRGIRDGRVDISDLLQPAINSAFVGTVTAVAAVTAVLPIAILSMRRRSKMADLASVAVIGGFAIPGIVIALSLVFWAINIPGMGWLYQTLPLLIVAYVIHFGSQAMGAAEGAVRAVPEQLRESAMLLRPSRLHRFRVISFPLMRPSLTSGAGLVLLSTIKELPTTLILSPIGFSTLSTKVWGSYADGFYAEVGVTSLLLIAVSATLTWILVLRRADVLSNKNEATL